MFRVKEQIRSFAFSFLVAVVDNYNQGVHCLESGWLLFFPHIRDLVLSLEDFDSISSKEYCHSNPIGIYTS